MKQVKTDCNAGFEIPAISSCARFLNMVSRSRTTGWRWRRNGWINVVTIAGRPYVRREDIEKFLARAERGEFTNEQPILTRFGNPVHPKLSDHHGQAS